jgi:hypothetical protein
MAWRGREGGRKRWRWSRGGALKETVDVSSRLMMRLREGKRKGWRWSDLCVLNERRRTKPKTSEGE